MKPPIQYSQFKRPVRVKGKNVSVNYLDRFWFLLGLEYFIKIRLRIPPLSLRFKYLAIGLYIMAWCPIPSQGRTVYADPIIDTTNTKQLQPLKTPPVTLLEPLQTAIHPLAASGTYANDYAWGNCTAYVAGRLPVPNSMGNAMSWGYVLSSIGYTVSDVPKVGAIAWSTNDYYLGHVAIVEAINGDEVIISEQNYEGLGVTDTRPASPGEFQYIYF